MKKLLFMFLITLLYSCSQAQSPKTDTPQVKEYTPPELTGAKDSRVLRYPTGYSVKSIIGGGIAEADPLASSCTEPGTVYIFYDDNALVQYIPFEGGFYAISQNASLTCEARNSTHPRNEWWDYISVNYPMPKVDYSHDPSIHPLEIKFLDNDGNLAKSAVDGTSTWDTIESLESYHYYVNPNGDPTSALRLQFELFGANDGVHVFHILMGGDGVSILPSRFSFY